MIYLYINKRILSRPVRNISTKKKLQYTYNLEIQKEDMVNLEELMIKEEDEMNEKVTIVESDEGD